MIRLKDLIPRDFMGALVQLCQVHGPKFGHPHQHAGGAAQHQIGAPDLGPRAACFHAARNDYRIGEAMRARFRQQGLFQPRRRDKEDPKIGQFASSPSVEAKNIAWLTAELT